MGEPPKPELKVKFIYTGVYSEDLFLVLEINIIFISHLGIFNISFKIICVCLIISYVAPSLQII